MKSRYRWNGLLDARRADPRRRHLEEDSTGQTVARTKQHKEPLDRATST